MNSFWCVFYSLDIESDEAPTYALDIGQAEIFDKQIELLQNKDFSKEELAKYLIEFYAIIIGEDIEPIELEEIISPEDIGGEEIQIEMEENAPPEERGGNVEEIELRELLPSREKGTDVMQIEMEDIFPSGKENENEN